MKNSNKFVEILTTRCFGCNNTFYEFSYYELENCPHCEAELAKGTCNIEETNNAHIQIDFKTGEIRAL
jgi:hypothetical protein